MQIKSTQIGYTMIIEHVATITFTKYNRSIHVRDIRIQIHVHVIVSIGVKWNYTCIMLRLGMEYLTQSLSKVAMDCRCHVWEMAMWLGLFFFM